MTLSSFSSLESEKAGNISSYFSMASWGHTDAAVMRRKREQRRENGIGVRVTFAFSSSTIKWHSEALKKYSLALYFRRGLSMVLIAT